MSKINTNPQLKINRTGGQAVENLNRRNADGQGICYRLKGVAAILITVGHGLTETGVHYGGGGHYKDSEGHYCHAVAMAWD
jgi:hypothetical protein